MTIQIRTYSELQQFDTIEDRFRYLSLRGIVGATTFGHDRWLNQMFYRSYEWKQIRLHVIIRDNGCDLGIDGYEINDKILIHHMNPMAARDIVHGNDDIVDPEYLITTCHNTHNAIHYGDASLLPKPMVARTRGDTKLW